MDPLTPELEHEIDLLQRVGRGSAEGLSELYDRFAGVLFATAFRIVNDQGIAEDVLQEVFVQIWEKAPLYDPARGKPLTWAISLTRHKAIDKLRSLQRRSRGKNELEEQAKASDQFDDRSSIDSVDWAEKGKLIREAMAALPDEQREAIELAFFSGLTQTEISERLNEPLGTIKARIRRGMLKLRAALAPRL